MTHDQVPSGARRMPSAGGRAPGRFLAPVAVLALAGAAVCRVGLVDPNEPGHYPVCPLRRLTGLWCPGCGGLRSVHALTRGDLPTAVGANALAVAGCAAFAVLWAAWAVRAVQGRRWAVGLGPGPARGLGALLVVFTIVRNLPFGAWLHP